MDHVLSTGSILPNTTLIIHRLKKALHIWGVLFMLAGMFSIPFQFHLLGFVTTIQRSLFLPVSETLAGIFGQQLLLTDLSSDSLGLYLLVLFLLLGTLPIAFLIKNKENLSHKLIRLLQVIAPYYLALILLKYGFDKLFLVQFPQPGPNLLYTPFGQQEKDILFWSVMGLSKGYMAFTGIAEIISALFLLFKQTRTFGAILSVIVFVHVLAINLSFDISVKLYSSFLLLLSAYLTIPFLLWLYRSLKNGASTLHFSQNTTDFKGKKYVKGTLLLIILLEVFTPYATTESAQKVPNLAFEIVDPHNGNQSFGKLYFHEDGFLILQDKNYQTSTYPILSFSKEQEYLIIEKSGQLKTLSFKKTGDQIYEISHPELNVYLNCNQLEIEKLPALQDNFHLTVDELIVH